MINENDIIILPIIGQNDGEMTQAKMLLLRLIDEHHLPIQLQQFFLSNADDKLTPKCLLSLLKAQKVAQALLLDHQKLVLIHLQNQTGDLLKVHCDWQRQTRRIINAGRKTEMLLQACKLSWRMTVLDGTAGFGHDALILASTGAMVTLFERNPIIALMLLCEYHHMLSHKNWQSLLERMTIVYGDINQHQGRADIIYLDPMFPKDSYSAKVGKHMQLLQNFVAPPDDAGERQLLTHAKMLSLSKVIVKRPIHAPFLAGQKPKQSWQNDAVRFDGYWA